jgi:hypothetical protein
MKIKNDVIQESLCLFDKKKLFKQLSEIDVLTHSEEVSTLIDINRKCLIINRCVHPNLFILSFQGRHSDEVEIVITESELYES